MMGVGCPETGRPQSRFRYDHTCTYMFHVLPKAKVRNTHMHFYEYMCTYVCVYMHAETCESRRVNAR